LDGLGLAESNTSNHRICWHGRVKAVHDLSAPSTTYPTRNIRSKGDASNTAQSFAMTDAQWLERHQRKARLRHPAPGEPKAELVLVTAFHAGTHWRFIRRPIGAALAFLDEPSHANDNDCSRILAETARKPMHRRQPWSW
jgi:hypothetical protein